MIEWSRNSVYRFMSVVETFWRGTTGILILTPLVIVWEHVPSFHEKLGPGAAMNIVSRNESRYRVRFRGSHRDLHSRQTRV